MSTATALPRAIPHRSITARQAHVRPWLSVIMPTYNGAAHLRAALAGLACQVDDGVEILAIDDGSTDDTLPLLRAFASRMPLTILQRQHRGNWVASTNEGLARAQGEWVCFLHQDDLWLENRLAVLRARLARHPGAVLTLHPSWYLDTHGRRLGRWSCPLPVQASLLERSLVVERLLVQNFISMPAPLFRRSPALEVGGLDESLWYTADWDFWLKLAELGGTAYVGQPLSGFRIHAGSQTVQRSRGLAAFREQLETVLDRHLQRWPSTAPLAPAIHRAARFSVELNVALAASVQRTRPGYASLASHLLHLGPTGLRSFWRDSRIAERIVSRLRARLVNTHRPSPATSLFA